MSMIHLILSKKDVTYEEKHIIELGISLWISEIIFKPILLQKLFDDWNQSQSQQFTTLTYTKVLIEDALLSSNSIVRNLIKDNLKFIAESVRSETLNEQPYIFFLKVLLTRNHISMGKARESQQFY
jgi:hypothetical protein